MSNDDFTCFYFQHGTHVTPEKIKPGIKRNVSSPTVQSFIFSVANNSLHFFLFFGFTFGYSERNLVYFISFISFLFYFSSRCSTFRASFEQLLGRNQRRAERFLSGGSLGRSLSRSLAGGLADQRERATLKEIQENETKAITNDDNRRSSLRVSSVCYR